MNYETGNERTVASILSDTKEEMKQFLSTRIEMLRAEMREKFRVVAAAAPLAIVGLVFLGTAYLLFALALVGLVQAAMPGNPFRWAIAFAAIAVLWAILGGIAASIALRKLKLKELLPNRTIKVLQEDKIWIQSEARNGI